ncbi:hypothetical protein Tco_0564056 [Tanacetum coccineum]
MTRLKDGSLVNSKYTWNSKEIKRKGKWVVGDNAAFKQSLITQFHVYVVAIKTTPYEILYGHPPPLHIPYVAKDSPVEMVDRTLQAREKTISEGLLAASPVKLLERKMVKNNNCMVVYGMIQWRNGSEEDVTWERLEDVLQRFPDFILDP